MDALLIGDASHIEMQSAADTIRKSLAGFQLSEARTIGQTLNSMRRTESGPGIVIILQNWPDEYLRRELEQLLATWPLARFVCCYGPWCASDGRTREVIPFAVRVPVYQARQRIRRELAVLRGQHVPLPLTAARDECFLFDRSAKVSANPTTLSEIRVGFDIADRAFQRYWLELSQHAGFGIAAGDQPDVVIVDPEPDRIRSTDKLRAVVRLHRPACVVAVLSLPCTADLQRLDEASVARAIPRMCSLQELQLQLPAALRTPLTPREPAVPISDPNCR